MSNPDEVRPEPLADAEVDRLVDGCLGETERRELILRLDDEPDGWRRCALAFLEDQAWRSALALPVATPKVVEVPADAPRRARPAWLRLSVAASMLAATFAVGFATGGAMRGTRQPLVARSDRPKVQPPAPEASDAPVREVGWIDVVDGSNGESPPGRVPILSGPGLDERWLRDQPPSVPDYVRAQWERQGYQVEERRRLVSLDLDDGRRVAIPVDEVNLEFVGQKPL